MNHRRLKVNTTYHRVPDETRDEKFVHSHIHIQCMYPRPTDLQSVFFSRSSRDPRFSLSSNAITCSSPTTMKKQQSNCCNLLHDIIHGFRDRVTVHGTGCVKKQVEFLAKNGFLCNVCRLLILCIKELETVFSRFNYSASEKKFRNDASVNCCSISIVPQKGKKRSRKRLSKKSKHLGNFSILDVFLFV